MRSLCTGSMRLKGVRPKRAIPLANFMRIESHCAALYGMHGGRGKGAHLVSIVTLPLRLVRRQYCKDSGSVYSEQVEQSEQVGGFYVVREGVR